MAAFMQQMRGLRNNPELRRYVLDGAEPTGKTLGTGSYGTVEEVKVNGVVCAGKIIHGALLEDGNHGVREIAEKYIQECQLMSQLRHPNITQFFGLSFLPSSPLPVLMMEKLHCSLDDLLETTPNIPLPLKRSMLEDVARGLLYLHTQSPSPIVHRDLSAKNVLLTTSFSAKITDLGNSRIVNLQPGQLARTLSRLPGTLSFMPPEALDDSSRYGPSLDVFSFGHLGLFTGLQVFPGTLRQPTYHDPDNPEALLGRSEVQRRGEYFDKLERKLPGGGQHPLVLLVKRCLHNTPSQRPTAEELLTALQDMKEGDYSDLLTLEASRHIAMTMALSRVKGKDEEIQELQQQLEQSQVVIEQKDAELNEARRENAQLQRQLAQAQTDLQRKDTRLNQYQREVQEKTIRLNEVQQEIERQNEAQARLRVSLEELRRDLEARAVQLRGKERELQQRDADISRLVGELRSCQAQLEIAQEGVRAKDELLSQREAQLATALPQQKQRVIQTPLSEPKLPLKFNWRRGRDTPFGMDSGPIAVVTNDDVYYGGGYAYNDKDAQTVCVYRPQENMWSTLPEYQFKWFGMAVVNETQLVLVGGRHPRTKKETNKLAAWDDKRREWKEQFPPMNIACNSPCAVSYGSWLLVAGGGGDQGWLSRVEVLNTSTGQWYQAPSLPVAGHQLSSTVVGNTWYVLGGFTGKGQNKSVMSVYLEDIISQAISLPTGTNTSTSPWKTLPNTPLQISTALAFQGALLTVGDGSYPGSSAMYLYQPSTGKWVKVGDTPVGRIMCGSTILPSGEIVIIGGSGAKSRVDIAQVI